MHTWGKSDGPSGIRLSFLLSVAGLVIPIAVILLVLRPPEQIAIPEADSAKSAQSFQTKLGQLQQMQSPGDANGEVHLTASEISSAFSQSDATSQQSSPVVSLHDDLVTGQFVTSLARQQLYITVSGHLGAKDGYVTFEPTDFKVGDLAIPVIFVNAALQRKIQEQRQELKLPEFIRDLRIEKGELVIRPK